MLHLVFGFSDGVRTGQRQVLRFGNAIMFFSNDVFHFKGKQRSWHSVVPENGSTRTDIQLLPEPTAWFHH